MLALPDRGSLQLETRPSGLLSSPTADKVRYKPQPAWTSTLKSRRLQLPACCQNNRLLNHFEPISASAYFVADYHFELLSQRQQTTY